MSSRKIIFITIILIILSTIGLFLIIERSSKSTSKTNQISNDNCLNCNILMIDVDILRADALPCYGYHRNTAPNICAFAEKSVTFKDNYSTSFWTLPSIFSTITSLYPTFHRVNTLYIDKLDSDIPTIAEFLHSKGYKTVYVGSGDDAAVLTKENGGLKGYDLITSEPIDMVITQFENETKPWFIHYYSRDLHMPYLIPNGSEPLENLPRPKNLPLTYSEYNILLNNYLKKHYKEVFQPKTLEKYKDIILGPDKPDDTKVAELFTFLTSKGQERDYLTNIWQPVFDLYMSSFDSKNRSDIDYVRMMYDTKLRIFDEKMEMVFQKLESEILSKNTTTIIMSDHGEAFGEHGTFSHENNHFSELYHTPLIIRSPSLFNRIVEQTSSNIDIFPTILDIVGLEQHGLLLQGKSLINGDDKNESFSIAESLDGYMVVNKNWLYYLPNNITRLNQPELYNKKEDPKETTNVLNIYPDLSNELYNDADIIRSYNNESVKEERDSYYTELKLDPEKIKRLQKEGYF